MHYLLVTVSVSLQTPACPRSAWLFTHAVLLLSRLPLHHGPPVGCFLKCSCRSCHLQHTPSSSGMMGCSWARGGTRWGSFMQTLHILYLDALSWRFSINADHFFFYCYWSSVHHITSHSIGVSDLSMQYFFIGFVYINNNQSIMDMNKLVRPILDFWPNLSRAAVNTWYSSISAYNACKTNWSYL